MKLIRRKSTGEIFQVIKEKFHLIGHLCDRCGGTGQFITMVLNGKPTGPGGICFRCEGKGYQTISDEKRNYGYDQYAFAMAARRMLG